MNDREQIENIVLDNNSDINEKRIRTQSTEHENIPELRENDADVEYIENAENDGNDEENEKSHSSKDKDDCYVL